MSTLVLPNKGKHATALCNQHVLRTSQAVPVMRWLELHIVVWCAYFTCMPHNASSITRYAQIHSLSSPHQANKHNTSTADSLTLPVCLHRHLMHLLTVQRRTVLLFLLFSFFSCCCLPLFCISIISIRTKMAMRLVNSRIASCVTLGARPYDWSALSMIC